MTQVATSRKLVKRNVTDRALRYRANATPPAGEKRCCLCGTKDKVEVGHVNGREEDGDQKNLFWTCRSCNVKCAHRMKKAGIGRPTKQYNPAAEGAQSYGQWVNAVTSMNGDGGDMDAASAVAMIHATPESDRSKFAREIWHRRRMGRSNPTKRCATKATAKKNLFGFGKSSAYIWFVREKTTPGSGRSWSKGSEYGNVAEAKAKAKDNAAKTGRTTQVVRFKEADRNKGDARGLVVAHYVPTKQRKKNLFGFGKSKTTYSSRLSKQAFDLGQVGSPSDAKIAAWLKRKLKFEDLSSSYASQLKRDYWRGADAKQEKAELRQSKPAKQTARAGGNTEYKGKTIKKVDGKFEVLGTDWNSLKDAKEYVDLYVASGGKARFRNPNWSLKQGKSAAFVYEAKTGTHEVDVISPGKPTESKSFSGPKSFRAASTWARLRLHEVANPKPGKFKIFPRGKARRNPIDTAAKMYEEFHGLPSTEVREYQETEHRHSVLAGIGALVSLQFMNVAGTKVIELQAPDPAGGKVADVIMLCVTEDGRQLMLVGGDQKIPLKALDTAGITEADQRDQMLIGTLVQITYRTKKTFEKKGEEEIDFYHDLGREGSKGVYPVLLYKPRNPSMEIFGGRYQVAKPEGSLGNVSPGIVG